MQWRGIQVFFGMLEDTYMLFQMIQQPIQPSTNKYEIFSIFAILHFMSIDFYLYAQVKTYLCSFLNHYELHNPLISGLSRKPPINIESYNDNLSRELQEHIWTWMDVCFQDFFQRKIELERVSWLKYILYQNIRTKNWREKRNNFEKLQYYKIGNIKRKEDGFCGILLDVGGALFVHYISPSNIKWLYICIQLLHVVLLL